jgi:hypothetical protein
MYQDISVLKSDGIINSLKKEDDKIYKQLKLEAKQFFNKHSPPSTITEWADQKALLYNTIVKKAGITFHSGLPFLTQETGSIKMEGYTIRNVFFQTLPGVFTTANLYIPDGKGPFPAIINLHGHIKGGRLAKSIQARAHILASNGFISLCADAFGSGERSVDHGDSDYHGGNMGAALFNLGKSLLGIQVSENIRCVDFLCSLDYVDKNAIGTTGESGGGNQAMWLGAMDERIKAVIPVVSVGTFEAFVMAHNCVCELLPDGLTFCEEFQILGLIAPRALNVCNALQETHAAFNASEMVRTVKNTGKIYKLFKADELFHVQIFNNTHEYSKEMQQAMLLWFNQHLKIAAMQEVKMPSVIYMEEEKLRVFSIGDRPPHITTLPQFLEREGRISLKKALCDKSNAEGVREKLKNVLHITELAPLHNINKGTNNGIVKLKTEDENVVTLICNPNSKDDQIKIADNGTEAAGQVFAVDLWGTGQQCSAVANYYDAQMVPFHTLSRSVFWLGKTVIGEWLIQIHNLITDILTTRPNAMVKIVGYREAGVAALFYAALNDNIESIELIDAPYSYLVSANIKTDFYSMAIILPGIIPWGDLVNATALCNCKISFVNARTMGGALISESEKDALVKTHNKQKNIYLTKSTLHFITL